MALLFFRCCCCCCCCCASCRSVPRCCCCCCCCCALRLLCFRCSFAPPFILAVLAVPLPFRSSFLQRTVLRARNACHDRVLVHGRLGRAFQRGRCLLFGSLVEEGDGPGMGRCACFHSLGQPIYCVQVKELQIAWCASVSLRPRAVSCAFRPKRTVLCCVAACRALPLPRSVRARNPRQEAAAATTGKEGRRKERCLSREGREHERGEGGAKIPSRKDEGDGVF